MQSRSQKLILVLGKCAAVFIVLAFIGTAVLFFLFKDDLILPNALNYIPSFKRGNLELVSGDGFPQGKLYYKTQTVAAVGNPIDGLEMISVFTQKSSGKENRITHLNNDIDEVKNGYVVFNLDIPNFDCFAVYIQKKVARYEPIEFSWLPTPSDVWLCEGYDFKQAP